MRKKNLILAWKFQIAIYVIVYFIKTFVEWEFKNPFKWIIDIPTYDNEIRGMILFFYTMGYTAIYFGTGAYLEFKAEEESKLKENEK